MLAEVYDAFKSAGVPEDQARAAATAVAGQPDFEARLDRLETRLDRLDQRVGKLETDVGILRWMVGFTLAFQVATLFFLWQILLRLPA